ncbi:MAG: carbohydrate kinase family protein [Pseudomonadota bacterium]
MSPCIHVLGPLAVDHVVYVEKLPGADDKAFVNRRERRAGGTPLAFARSVARWGADVRIHSLVGDDGDGDFILTTLGNDGIETSAIERFQGSATIANMVILDGRGERAILIEPMDENQLLSIGKTLSPAQGDGVATNLFHPDAVSEALCSARAAGAMTLVELELPELKRFGMGPLQATLANADITCTNRQVLSDVVGVRGSFVEAADRFADQFASAGDLCITLGAAGAVIYGSEGLYRIDAPQVTPVDTTGAGDTFGAAFLYARLGGASLEQAGKCAVAAASLFVAGKSTAWCDVDAMASAL